MEEQLIGLSEVFLKIDPRPWQIIDPFSQAYRELVLDLYRQISSNAGYYPLKHEKTEAAITGDAPFNPIPYRFAKSSLVGEFLVSYGWILRNLNVRAGAEILEYGAERASFRSIRRAWVARCMPSTSSSDSST